MDTDFPQSLWQYGILLPESPPARCPIPLPDYTREFDYPTLSIAVEACRASDYLYMISAWANLSSLGAWKFGRSHLPNVRIAQLARQVGCEFTMEYIVPCTDATALEQCIHKSLRDRRLVGEWFLMPESLVEHYVAWTDALRIGTHVSSWPPQYDSDNNSWDHQKAALFEADYQLYKAQQKQPAERGLTDERRLRRPSNRE